MIEGTEMRCYGGNWWVEGVTQGQISKAALQQMRQVGRKRGYRVTIKAFDDASWSEIGPNVCSETRGKVPLYYWIKA